MYVLWMLLFFVSGSPLFSGWGSISINVPQISVPPVAPPPADINHADAISFSGTGLFQVRGFSGTIGMSDAAYDSYLHWSSGTGVNMVCEVVDSATNRVSLRVASSNKYLTVQDVQNPDAETSKIKLISLPSGASFDASNLFMQFYIEGSNNIYKIKSAATGGYLVASTGAFFRAATLGSDGKYSVPATAAQAATFNFIVSLSSVAVKAGDVIRIKNSSGGYLGFNDAGDFVFTTPSETSAIQQFKVDSYDAATNVATFKVFNQSLCSVATPGSKYGGMPFSFAKSFRDAPAQFIIESEPTKPNQFYLKLIAGISKFYLRSSSSSAKVIASIVTDLAQRYLLSIEPGVADPKDALYGVTLLGNLTLQKVQEDLTNRFAVVMKKDLSAKDWGYLAQALLAYVQAASKLPGWNVPLNNGEASLCDMAIVLLQKIPATVLLAKEIAALIASLKDVGLPGSVGAIGVNDVVMVQGASGEFLVASETGAIVSSAVSLYDPAAHMKLAAFDPSTKALTLRIGNNYVSAADSEPFLRLSPTQSSVAVRIDDTLKKFSFLSSASTPVTVQNEAKKKISTFSIAQKVTSDFALFNQSLVAMQGVLTKDVVLANLSKVFQPFMVKPQKPAVDWAFFVNFVISFLTKASKDIPQWKVPSIDISDQGQIKRISLSEYASILVGYIADPFSPAPADVQAKARTFLQTLTAPVSPAAPAPAASTSTPFVQGGLVLLQSADGVKTLMVNAQGVAQFLTGVTKFNPLIQAQVVAYEPAPARVKLAFNGRCFDQAATSFSSTNTAAAPYFTLEETSDPLVSYLTLGQGKRLVLGDSFASGCSLNSQGTPFKITALNSVYSSLPQVQSPATPQEFENNLKAYISAFDLLRGSSDDMTFIFQGLKDYCTFVADSPDWSLRMNGAIIVNDSPLNYVKSSLQTMLTLSSRYAGLTSALKSAIQQFAASPIFTPIQISSSLATGASCVLKIDDTTALTVDSTGACRAQNYTNLLEPSIHGKVDRFDPATLSLNFSLTGKKMGTNAANQLVAADAYGAFRVVNEGQSGYSIMNTQNKKLRYDPNAKTIVFADAGTIVQLALIQPNRCLLDGLSGVVVKDLRIFESALMQVRTSADDVSFIVDKLIQYAQQASQAMSWYTTTGIDSKNPSTTTRDYAVVLLKRVKDSPSIFTAVPQALKDKILTAVSSIQDNLQLYSQQINLLDGLAAKLKEASTVTLSSELMQMLNGLIDKVVAGGNVEQRVLLLQKVESYGSAEVVAGLAQASASAKMAWDVQNVRLMDKLLVYDAADANAWEDKFDLIKNKLFARVLKAPAAEKASLMQILLNSSVKKLVAEGSGMSAQLTSWKSLKQQLNNFLFDNSQQLLAPGDAAQTALLTDVQKKLNLLLVDTGMKKGEVPVEPESQLAPESQSTPEPLSETPVVSTPPPLKKTLIPGLIYTAQPSEWGSGEVSPMSPVQSVPLNNGNDVKPSRNEQSAPEQIKFEI